MPHPMAITTMFMKEPLLLALPATAGRQARFPKFDLCRGGALQMESQQASYGFQTGTAIKARLSSFRPVFIAKARYRHGRAVCADHGKPLSCSDPANAREPKPRGI